MVYKVPRTLTHMGLYYHEHVPLLRMDYNVNTSDLNNLIDLMFNESIALCWPLLSQILSNVYCTISNEYHESERHTNEFCRENG